MRVALIAVAVLGLAFPVQGEETALDLKASYCSASSRRRSTRPRTARAVRQARRTTADRYRQYLYGGCHTNAAEDSLRNVNSSGSGNSFTISGIGSPRTIRAVRSDPAL
jgi:hypothetical protein